MKGLSITNELKARGVIGEPEPYVGMGATMLVGSDRYACTIHRIYAEAGKQVLEVTHDETKLIAGSRHSEEQEYSYSPRPDHPKKHYFAKSTLGFWEEMHYKVKSSWYDEKSDTRHETLSSRLSKCGNSVGLRIGERDEYRDPSF